MNNGKIKVSDWNKFKKPVGYPVTFRWLIYNVLYKWQKSK